ncbi:MAG TPA: hypothetical protein PKI83_03145 [Bacteroidales bacterium]|nr:hypothetical protein [Bacteroidales bacterium]
MKKILSLFLAIALLTTMIIPLVAEPIVVILPENSTAKVVIPDIPDTDSMYMYNAKYETINVKIETGCRCDAETITYIIRKTPQGAETGDGKIIGEVKAKGVYNLPQAMKEWSKENKINAIWTYDESGTPPGNFTTPCPKIFN